MSSERAGFAGSYLHRLLVGLIALKVLVLIVAFDPAGLDAFELTKAQVGRVLAWPMAAGVALALYRYGRTVVPSSMVHAFVGAYLIANAVSAAFAEVPYLAFYGERGNYFGLTFFLDMAILYAAASISLRRVQDVAFVAGAILLGTVATAGYSVLQFFGLDPVKWPVDVRRPIGTFGSTVRHAHFLAIAFTLATASAVWAPRGRWQSAVRIIGAIAAIGSLALAGAVGSRGFFLGLAGGVTTLALVAAIGGGYSWRRIAQMSIGLALLAVVAVGFLLTTPAGQRAGERVAEFAAEERLITYRVALEAFASRPLTGFGPDSFPIGYTRHRTVESRLLGLDIIENSAHNWPLQILVTTGLLGLTAFLWLLSSTALVVKRIFRRHQLAAGAAASGVGAYLASGLVSVGSNGVEWYLWLAMGTVLGLSVDSAASVRRSLPMLGQAGVLLVAAGIGVTFAAPSLEASRAALVASSAYTQSLPDPAEASALRAVRADQGRSAYWNWLGLARTLNGEWKVAGDAFAGAATRAPYDSTYWQNLARARTLQSLGGDQSSGGSDAAIAAIRQAIETEPIELSSYELGAELLYSMGRPEEALEIAVEGQRRAGFLVGDDLVARASKVTRDNVRARGQIEILLMARESAPLRVALARVALGMGDTEAARVNARRALEMDPGNAEAQQILRDSGG